MDSMPAVWPLGGYLVLAGLLALAIGALHRSGRRGIDRSTATTMTFPLLAVTTTMVIAVVRSSLALSLGLVGALSIVRFRSAVKEPDELVHLFLCIAVGLALGAELPHIAILGVVIFALYALLGRRRRTARTFGRYLIVIDGDVSNLDELLPNVKAATDGLGTDSEVQRCDVDGSTLHARILVTSSSGVDGALLVSRLRERLDGCRISVIDGSCGI